MCQLSALQMEMNKMLNYSESSTTGLQGNPSDSDSLQKANASQARALVFLAHSHRPSRVSLSKFVLPALVSRPAKI